MKIIITHENTDFDGIAAMLGAWKLNPDALPIMPRRPNRNVRDFVTLYGDQLPFVRADDVPRRPIEIAIIVDTQAFAPFKGMNSRTQLHFIDHHPASAELSQQATVFVEEVGATTTLLVEQLSAASLSLTPVEATLMLLGIYEDTGKLSYGTTTPRDLRAAAWLLDQGANLSVVNDFLQYPISEEQRALYNLLVEKSEPYQFAGHSIIISAVRAGALIEEVSTLAHKLRDLFDPDALFVIVQMNEHIQMVARSSTEAIDVATISEAFGGGGHGRAAAALIRGMTLREVHDRLLDLLERHVRPSTTVAQIMSQGVHTLDINATVSEAAMWMSRLGHEGFPVVHNGRVAGILTRREIDRAMQLSLGDAPVGRYMTPGEIQVTPEDSVEKVQSLMLEYGIGQVPVVKDGVPVGIVTRTDLLKLWSSPKDRPPRALDLAQKMERVLPLKKLELLRLAGDLADEMDYSLYIVGGFVRDLLLDIPNLDLDLVVEGNAIRLARELARRVGGRVRSHARFGTAKWLPEPQNEWSDVGPLDFATARTEFYERPTALPQVERSSIRHDLHRRDFTINTLALCLNRGRFGELLDFYGGEADLHRRLIRVLHSLSFVEDPTRMLRAVRLEQRLGFQIESRTAELLAGALDLLQRTTPERIRHELYLILAEEQPERAIVRLSELGILSHIEPALSVDNWYVERAHWLRGAVRGDRELLEGAPFDISEIEVLQPQASHLPAMYLALLTYRLSSEATDAFVRRLRILRAEATVAKQASLLREAMPNLSSSRLRNSEIYEILHPFDSPALTVAYVACDSWLVRRRIELYQRRLKHVAPLADGHALKAMGIPPGPLYGQIIDRLRKAWLDEEVTDAESEAVFMLKLLNEQANWTEHPSVQSNSIVYSRTLSEEET